MTAAALITCWLASFSTLLTAGTDACWFRARAHSSMRSALSDMLSSNRAGRRSNNCTTVQFAEDATSFGFLACSRHHTLIFITHDHTNRIAGLTVKGGRRGPRSPPPPPLRAQSPVKPLAQARPCSAVQSITLQSLDFNWSHAIVRVPSPSR